MTTDPSERHVSQRGTYTWAIDEMQYLAPAPGLRALIDAARSRRISVIGPVSQDYGQLCRDLEVKPHPVSRGSGGRINPPDFGADGKEKR